MATSANGLERQSALQDVYYAPGAHAQLVSLGKLEGQGWDGAANLGWGPVHQRREGERDPFEGCVSRMRDVRDRLGRRC